VVAVATPRVGVVKIGFVKVLFVSVSVPARVARVPVVGKVTDVAAVLVNVVAKAPEVVKLPPKVMVLVPLSTPVPPLAPGKIPVTPDVKGNPVAFVNTAALGVPKAGVTNVGEVPNTNDPEPVSSETTPANSAEVVADKALILSVVTTNVFEEGMEVPLILVAVATPNAGVVKVGFVKVLFVSVSVPAKVARVPETAGKVIAVLVPATAGAEIVAVPDVEPENPTLVAVATPKVGVTNVGDVARTTFPEPVVAISSTTPALPVKLPSTLPAATF
jgi:hypothetical protein